MSGDSVVLAAVGDTLAGFDPPEAMFQHVQAALRDSDLRFAQVENVFSERGTCQYQGGGLHPPLPPRLAEAYKSVPFDVVSLASNLTSEWGSEGVEGTLETFQKLGIATVGAGRLAEARKPVILERKGIRIAFLAYCSVLLPQSWATEERAGAAPMRAKTYYETVEYQPGAPPRVVTIPVRRDLEQLQEDVRRATREADFVAVSMHWGVHFVTKPLADYQPLVGHAAIDAGAGLVLGHHPHLIQGIEQYKDAVIFYGLGNFGIYRKPGHPVGRCLPTMEYSHHEIYSRDVAPGLSLRYNHYWPNGLLAYAEIDRQGLSRVEVAPAVLDANNTAVMVEPGSDKFEEIRRYALWASKGIEGGIEDLPVESGRMLVYAR